MLLSVKTLPEYYGEIIKEELNIKRVEFGSDLSKYVSFEIKPNLPVIGKEFGRYIPGIKKEIASRSQMELAQSINSGAVVKINVQGTEIELSSSNLLVTMQGLEGYAFAGEGELGVVLETTIDDELREEGNLREILSKVQTMRKESGFQVADKINLYVKDNLIIAEVIKKFEDYIKKETLCVNVIYGDGSAQNYTECSINGEKLNVAVEVVK